MQWGTCRSSVAVLVLLAGGTVYGNTWADHFTNWSGADAAARSDYTDTNGANPDYFFCTTPQGTPAAGFLSQDSGTFAKFWDAAGGVAPRWRFRNTLPTSMKGTNGFGVAWRMNLLDDRNFNRGPVQISFTADGTSTGTPYDAYFLIKSSLVGTDIQYTVQPQANGGAVYAGINAYSLPVLNQLLNSWHTWTVTVKVLAAEEFPAGSGTMKQFAYFNLWLDGTPILFTGGPNATSGAQGSPVGPDGLTYSFRVASESVSPQYIGLGDLGYDNYQNYLFDWVTFRDDDNAYFDGAPPGASCDAGVSPSAPGNSTAVRAMAAQPASLAYTVANLGTNPTSYTVAETDSAGNALPGEGYSWFTVSGAGGPIAPGGSEGVTVSIVNTDLAAGTYTGYFTITRTCLPTKKYTQQVNLTIIDCAFSVTPAAEVARSFVVGSVGSLANAMYTITNAGTDNLTYHVQKEGSDHAWLTLSKSDGGPLGNGQADTVTASLDPTGVGPGVHTCQLRFSSSKSGCTDSPPDVLCTIVLNVLNVNSASREFVAEFTTFTGSDATSLSPLASCDSGIAASADFHYYTSGQVDQLDPGWLTQGSIGGVATTAKFFNPQGPASAGLSGVGRARFRAFLPFDSTYDPAKGLAVAWRMRIGNYSPVRGPIQITVPAVAGPYDTGFTGTVFDCYVRIRDGRNVNILDNSGNQLGGILTYTLPASIAGDTDNDYHQWTAAACCQASDNKAYWNLWIDGQKLLFGGTEGSPLGPGGAIFSFRTGLDGFSGVPYIGLGELGTSTDIWNFEFDWVRTLSYNLTGCPFWDGGGCVPMIPCPTPFADSDKDGDVDMEDFAVFQSCINTGLYAAPASLPEACRCFDRNDNKVIGDAADLARFIACGSGKDIAWQPRPGCE